MRAPAAALRSGWNWTPASGPDSTAATIGAVVVDRRDDDLGVLGLDRVAVGEVDVGAVEPVEDDARA